MKYIREFKLYEGVEDQLKKYGLTLTEESYGFVIGNGISELLVRLDKMVKQILIMYELGFRISGDNIMDNKKFIVDGKALKCNIIEYGYSYIIGGFIYNTNEIDEYLNRLKGVNKTDYIGICSMNTNIYEYLASKYEYKKINKGFEIKSDFFIIEFEVDDNNLFQIRNITFNKYIGIRKDEFDTKFDILINAAKESFRDFVECDNYNENMRRVVLYQIDGFVNNFDSYSLLGRSRIINKLLEIGKNDTFILDKIIGDDELFHMVKDKLNNKLMNKYLELINNNDSLI